MADILIKNMEMPTNCGCCDINDDGWCQLVEDHVGWHVHDERCPLVEVPTHGDLKDADKMFSILERSCCTDSLADTIARDILKGLIKNAPTIIEASTSPTGFCNTEGCTNSKPDMSEAQNHICPYYKSVCSLDERIICYRQHLYEVCDKFIVASKETDNE